MALHRGLVWLADGFDKCDRDFQLRNSKKPPQTTHSAGGAGDGFALLSTLTTADSVSKHLKNLQPKMARVKSASHIMQLSSKNGHGRPRSHSIVSPTHTHIVPYSERMRALRSEAKTSRRPVIPRPHQSNVNVSVPKNLTPRSGGWVVRPKSSGNRRLSLNTQTESMVIYDDLPAHPDLRYFDRHSKCFNHTQGSGDVTSTKPSTACAAGKSTAIQCDCCGEITSQLRYQYGPSGSAMTEMQTNNRTFLYPDRVMNVNSTKVRQRPSSAPCGRVS